MSSEMQERIARSIYESRNGVGCRAWPSLPKAHKAHYIVDALAAMKAMREATFGMRDAATRRHQGPDECLYGSVFTAMIDHEIRAAEEDSDA
ncbi:hypothetical protein [Xanthobacter agilis]|uniref:Uncharacterized protein n=1 Tax=Xanthobacter agilis TaxID=47492 RepID=A0ABU0LFT1_XANAG|nr:hypothetical protein [Xanthobacter agilis]MDQ0506002.1 hypothetical protein [Xanthobacter agilis]